MSRRLFRADAGAHSRRGRQVVRQVGLKAHCSRRRRQRRFPCFTTSAFASLNAKSEQVANRLQRSAHQPSRQSATEARRLRIFVWLCLAHDVSAFKSRAASRKPCRAPRSACSLRRSGVAFSGRIRVSGKYAAVNAGKPGKRHMHIRTRGASTVTRPNGESIRRRRRSWMGK